MNLSKIFEQFARKIKNISPSDVAKLEDGAFDISIKKTTTTPRKASSKNFEINSVISELENASSRDAASAILIARGLTLADLGKIATILEITYRKGEKKEQLLERIVEKTVGYKLNSKAVRGEKDN